MDFTCTTTDYRGLALGRRVDPCATVVWGRPFLVGPFDPGAHLLFYGSALEHLASHSRAYSAVHGLIAWPRCSHPLITVKLGSIAGITGGVCVTTTTLALYFVATGLKSLDYREKGWEPQYPNWAWDWSGSINLFSYVAGVAGVAGVVGVAGVTGVASVAGVAGVAGVVWSVWLAWLVWLV